MKNLFLLAFVLFLFSQCEDKLKEYNKIKDESFFEDLVDIEFFYEEGKLMVAADTIYSLSLFGKNLTDLSEVEIFRNLEELGVSFNHIGFIDVAKSPLLKLFTANNNRLASLNLSNNPALEYINLNNNDLRELDVSACKGLWQYAYFQALPL